MVQARQEDLFESHEELPLLIARMTNQVGYAYPEEYPDSSQIRRYEPECMACDDRRVTSLTVDCLRLTPGESSSFDYPAW